MANSNGTPIWFELTTPDATEAQRFYEALAGWQVAPAPIADSGGYLVAGPDAENGVAGLMTANEQMPTGWWIYFASDDVDAMAARITELGGTVHVGPMDIPQVGRFASATDPQGVRFNIMKGISAEDSRAFRPGSSTNYGRGVWIELATADPDAAIAFYGALFGWSRQGGMSMGEMGDYSFVGRSEEDTVGAIWSSTLGGAPAAWSWYIHVPDIDAATATARDRGGTVLQEPVEIPGGDFAANIVDAQGFHIGVVGART